MSYNFGTPKSASGFTLPTSSAPTTTSLQFNFSGAGDLKTTTGKPTNLLDSLKTTAPSFGFTGLSSTSVAATTSTTGLTFGATAFSTPQFGLGTGLTAKSTTSTPSLNFGPLAASSAPSTGFSTGTSTFSLSTTTTTATTTGWSIAGLGTTATTIATTTTATTAFPSSGFNIGSTSSVVTSVSSLPATGSLTFAQLEESINKWTIDLEEQGKVFGSQARHLNAWDRLLITNGEKILDVSNGIERVKQQQQQLDQELDFVVSQQKELEDCIVPLEKELENITVSDPDRDHTYKLAENIDAQLKQMSEDLKEIIEHLNESNRTRQLSDPVAQIGRILNAHMNSLQWIDRNTTLISSHLDEIAKMHDLNKRNNETVHGA